MIDEYQDTNRPPVRLPCFCWRVAPSTIICGRRPMKTVHPTLAWSGHPPNILEFENTSPKSPRRFRLETKLPFDPKHSAGCLAVSRTTSSRKARIFLDVRGKVRHEDRPYYERRTGKQALFAGRPTFASDIFPPKPSIRRNARADRAL